MIDQDFLEELAGLGTAAGDRVRLGNANQADEFPVIVVRRSGGSRPRVMNGKALFERSEFAVHVLTREYSTAYPVANAILNHLHGTRTARGFTGLMGATSVKSCRCIRFPSDESEVDGDKVVRWVAMAFLFMHSEV